MDTLTEKFICLDNFLPYDNGSRHGIKNHPIPKTVMVMNTYCDDHYDYIKTTEGIFQRAQCYSEMSPYGWNPKTKEPNNAQI